VVLDLKVRDLEGSYSLDGSRQAPLGFPVSCHPQTPSSRPQRAQDLRAIKTLTLTVVAKGHRSSASASLRESYTRVFVFQPSSFTSAL
jgi:hypothetical protein